MINLRSLRKLHKKLAPIVFIPLLVTVITGVIFNVAEIGFNVPDDNKYKQLLMTIHKGAYLGENLGMFYVILNGLGVILMLLTGISMLKRSNRRQRSSE